MRVCGAHVILLAVASVLVAPLARANEAADIEYEKAVAAFKRQAFEEALAALERAYSAEPKAVYVYNMGRALEELGRIEAAQQAYLRTPAIAGVTDELRALAARKAESLASVADKAVLRFSGLPKGVAVQVDDEIVPDTTVDLVVAPGLHTLCVSEGEKIRCHARRLIKGIRLVWPPADAPGSRARLTLDLADRLAVLRLGGVRVVGDWKRVKVLELDAAATTVAIRERGGAQWSKDIELAGDETVLLSALAPGAARAPGVESGAAIDSTATASPWSWILVGTGAAATAAGVGLLVHAKLLQSPDDGATQAEAASDWETARPFVTPGWTLVGAGTAVLVGGLVWHFVTDGAPIAADVQTTTDGALLMLRGRW